MNAIGLVITALPVRQTLKKPLHCALTIWRDPFKFFHDHLCSPLSGALLDRSPRPHRVCDWLSGPDVRDRVGRLSLRLAGLHGLPPELQRNELQLRARVSARRLASLIHRPAVSDSQVRKSS